MKPYDFFKLYTAINLHCKVNSSYDFFKYHGATKSTEESFNVRKDKYFFQKFSKLFSNPEDAIGFIFSNFFNGNSHITQFDTDVYRDKWVNLKESLSYDYENFLIKFSIDKSVSGLINRIITEEDSLYMLIVLNYLMKDKIIEKLNSSDNFSWEEIVKPSFLKQRKFIETYWLTEDIIPDLLDITKKIMYK